MKFKKKIKIVEVKTNGLKQRRLLTLCTKAFKNSVSEKSAHSNKSTVFWLLKFMIIIVIMNEWMAL